MEKMSEAEIDRCEFWLTANRLVRESRKENYAGCKIPVNSDWDLDLLQDWLQGYHDQKVIDYLRFGWPLNNAETAINDSIPPTRWGLKSTR